MNKRYENENGRVAMYKDKHQWLVYGNANALTFMVKINCPVEAERIFNYWRDRIYVAPQEATKDRVKLGMSPSAQVSEI